MKGPITLLTLDRHLPAMVEIFFRLEQPSPSVAHLRPSFTLGFQTPNMRRYLDPQNTPKIPSYQVFGSLGLLFCDSAFFLHQHVVPCFCCSLASVGNDPVFFGGAESSTSVVPGFS